MIVNFIYFVLICNQLIIVVISQGTYKYPKNFDSKERLVKGRATKNVSIKIEETTITSGWATLLSI